MLLVEIKFQKINVTGKTRYFIKSAIKTDLDEMFRLCLLVILERQSPVFSISDGLLHTQKKTPDKNPCKIREYEIRMSSKL